MTQPTETQSIASPFENTSGFLTPNGIKKMLNEKSGIHTGSFGDGFIGGCGGFD